MPTVLRIYDSGGVLKFSMNPDVPDFAKRAAERVSNLGKYTELRAGHGTLWTEGFDGTAIEDLETFARTIEERGQITDERPKGRLVSVSDLEPGDVITVNGQEREIRLIERFLEDPGADLVKVTATDGFLATIPKISSVRVS